MSLTLSSKRTATACSRLIVAVLVGGAACCASAQKNNTFPKKDDPLHVRVAMFDQLMRDNHWNEGIFMQEVIFPPAGTEKPLVASQEDGCGITAEYLAGYSHMYHATRDPRAREWADKVFEGIEQLERVTGVPGVVARSFNKTDKPLWHEKVYFFSTEWHWSKSMPGYRWQGDLSSDKFVDLCYGLSTYFDLCADDEHKQRAAAFIDRFVGRCVDHNFKLVDYDGKMTLWGNFCPDLPHEPLNSLEMLAGLRTAYHMTGKPRYLSSYRMLIERYHYDEQALFAKVLFPKEWTVPWDDHLAAKSYWQLLRYETDPLLLNKYRTAMNRHWWDWKTSEFPRINDIWYHMLYQVLTGEQVVGERCVAAIKNMQGFERRKRTFRIPTDDGGAKEVESESEGNSTDMFVTYWFGRDHGIIDPGW